MKAKLFFTVLSVLLNIFVAKSQEVYSGLRSYVVSIGYADSVTIDPISLKKEKRFVLVGSGLVTYNKIDTAIITSIVTAKHVIKLFEASKRDSFYIRFSWADTISISAYFGLPVPLYISNNSPTFFYHKNGDIDLGCILIPYSSTDNTINAYYSNKTTKIFPYNRIVSPELGDNVLVYGYPGHIEGYFAGASFIVCTFKPGQVTWKSSNQTNTYLDNILLVESNASYGNSGGPVFSLNNGLRDNGVFNIGGDLSLVGILIGGTEENNDLKLSGKSVIDPATGKPYYTINRSGVAVVIKAELVKDLLNQVNQVLSSSKK